MTATAAPLSKTDQAIEILRRTDDGDRLDPQDLGLIQSVVNGQALSEKGETYWSNLVEAVANGSYVARHFCGIPGLTRDGVGYVYWKGKCVEHYSHSSDRRQEMIEEARRLAAAALVSERRGSGQTPLEVLSELSDAPGMDTPRHLVMWVMRHEVDGSIAMTSLPVNANDRAGIKQETAAARESAYAALGADVNSLRCMLVCTVEDLENVRLGIESDIHWSQRFGRGGHQVGQDARERFAAMAERINAGPALATAAQIEHYLLSPELERVTAISEKNLADVERDMNRFESARERAA